MSRSHEQKPLVFLDDGRRQIVMTVDVILTDIAAQPGHCGKSFLVLNGVH